MLWVLAAVCAIIALCLSFFLFARARAARRDKPRFSRAHLPWSSTIIIGHRGIPTIEHENSLESFRELEKHGVPGTEFDANVTADGRLVVYHDYSLDRLFGTKRVITEATLAELKRMRIALFNKENGERAWTTIPTLEEAFETLKDAQFLNLELKSNKLRDIGLERKVADLITHYKLAGKIVISSFDPFSLARFSKLLPDIPRGLIVSHGNIPLYLRKFWFLPFAKADFIHYNADFLGTGIIEKYEKQGYVTVFWGINNINLLDRAMKHDPYFIISDIPHILAGNRNGEQLK